MSTTATAPSDLVLFISHSSADAQLARDLITLLERSLKLHARQIRATSVSGYRLPVGADTDEQLRREIFVARAFLGLLTPTSIDSAYVLFELGARWGARRHLAPLMARGADPSFLRGPLSGLNALQLRDRTQVLQLLEDLSEYLELRLEPQASFQDAIDLVVASANIETPASLDTPPEPALSNAALSDDEVTVLSHLTSGSTTSQTIAQRLGVTDEKAKYWLSLLDGKEMVDFAPNMNGPSRWYLKQAGRAALVSRGLL